MKRYPIIKSWMMAGLVAIFISACATSQEEMPTVEDGAAGADQSQTDGSAADGSGADATGLDGSDSGDGTAIVDGTPMTAAELLDQCEGALANRIV